MRDWFFYVVWSLRLKKILKAVYASEQGSLIFLTARLKRMMLQCFDPKVPFESFRSQFTQKQE